MRPLDLGNARSLSGAASGKLLLPPDHLLTHGMAVGMTGSGKTGLLLVTIEEALRSGVPVLVVDLKGDLPNLALAFPDLGPEPLLPWAASLKAPSDPRTVADVAREMAEQRRQGLAAWGVTAADLQHYNQTTQLSILTPGSSAGQLVHLLSALERPSQRWQSDRESAVQSLSAAISLLLRLVGRDADPARSREHVLLSVLAHLRLSAGEPAQLGHLIHDLLTPPMASVGALEVDGFVSSTQRATLAALNSLLVAPSFANWREGVSLDVGSWLTPQLVETPTGPAARTPAVVFSVAHLEEEERALTLGLLLDEVLSWVRTLPGTRQLRALVVIDEVFGLLPPHPANPPTKGPIVSLMKQARAYGVGILLATQNPMDLDYRALSNAGVWAIGKLQTDADRARVIDGLALSDAGAGSPKDLNRIVKKLSHRWFLFRDVHAEQGVRLLQPRWAYSFMRGPMTRAEIQRMSAR
jgi:hypothetical protein